MNRLGPRLLQMAALASVAASGCIIERRYVRDVPGPPVAPPPRRDVDDDRHRDSRRADPGPGVEMDEEAFYDRLAPYGTWRWTPEYGRVWVPSGVSAEWRPYSDGRWALTDWGWTYVSDWPWAWAGYHYGRWSFAGGFGWYWIPGRFWGPAWVSWRYSPGWVAWAPLGPRGWYWGVRSPAWVVVRDAHFTRPIRTVALPAGSSASIVAAARPQPLRGPARIAGAGVVQGPPVARVSGGQRIRPVPVARVLPHAGMGGAVSRLGSGIGRYGPGRDGGPRGGSIRGGRPGRWHDGRDFPRALRPRGRWGEERGWTPRFRGGGEAPRPSARGDAKGTQGPSSSGRSSGAVKSHGGGHRK